MRKSDGVRVHHEKKSDGWEFTMRKKAMGESCHERKSDGVRVYY